MQVDTAVTPVEATTLAGSVAVHDYSIWGLFMQADFVVKAVILMLLFASFWSWAIVFEKLIKYRMLRNQSDSFEREFWSADALDQFHEKVRKRKNHHPMAVMFRAAMEEWFRSKQASQKMATSGSSIKIGVRDRIAQMMSVARNRELDKLETGLGFLATVGTSAPFIGLFGTVWGIMNSFQSIAVSKNTSLAVVAPGIAEALFATAIGLLAAIPAVIFYNKFSNELGRYAMRLDDFSTEFSTLISRQIDGSN